MRQIGILLLALAMCCLSSNATGEPITDPSQLSPNPTIIDFEAIPNFANPLIIGEVTFTSVTASLSLLNVNTPNWPVAGVEVAGLALFPGGEPDSAIRITFENPVSEFLLGWGDPNFSGNFLRAYDANEQLLEEIAVPTGPINGVFATWVGFKRPTADIATVMVQPDQSYFNGDDYVIDNIHYNTAAAPPPVCVQPPDGLISWWPLDETTGTAAADIVGENDGTHVNGPIPVAGNVAGALRFDGIDDYVDLGSNSSLNIPGSVTIDAWVKIIGDVVRWYNYFVADFDNTGWVSQLSLGVYSVGGNFQFYSYEGRSSGDNTYVLSSADKTEDQWYHVAVVRDDVAKEIKLYVNGNLEGSKSYAGKVPVSLQGNKYLGSSSPFGDYFNGDLDEVEIYNRALSESEIQAIFEAGSAGKCKGVVVNQPPVAQCKDVSVMADSVCTAAASINNGSYDPDGDPITLTQSPPGPYPLSNTSVTLTVADNEGASSQCTGTVTVVDNTPPTITSISVNPSVLWPPNHKMVRVMVAASASDNCDARPACKITSVSSNEPENGLGDGDTASDWQIIGNLTVNLRAERSGTGIGRIYTIAITCTDTSGNSSNHAMTVAVPHDQGKK